MILSRIDEKMNGGLFQWIKNTRTHVKTNMGYGISISATISILLFTHQAMAAVPAENVNTVNNGRIIRGKTYYNTPGAVTSFVNSGSGGLWLKSGNTLRGQEVDASGNLTSRGGAVHLFAPGNVVRLDGNIDVNGLRNKQGAYIGSGGRVFIDSAYLFQNGNIYANGYNGGQVQINVGGMTLGAGAQIQANGFENGGGVVTIHSSGPVDIRRQSVIQTSGLGFEGSNVINIEGSLVHVDGTLKADTAQADIFQGGTIRLVATGQSDLSSLKANLQAATQKTPGDATAPTLSSKERALILQRADNQIKNHDGDVVIGRDINNTKPTYIGLLQANGMPPEQYRIGNHGGSIIIAAMRDIVNQGRLIANGAKGKILTFNSKDTLSGSNGGTISLIAMNNIMNDKGQIEANGGNGLSYQGVADTDGDPSNGSGGIVSGIVGGEGGKGGLIAFGYGHQMMNTGDIYANGGQGGDSNPAILNGSGGKGGLVVFSGDTNPTGNGSIQAIGRSGGNGSFLMGGKAGTIVSPDPATLGPGQVYFQQGYENGQPVSHTATQKTQTDEVLVDNDNGAMIALTKNGGSSPVNLLTRLLNANYRTVDQPTGFTSEILKDGFGMSFANLVVQSSQNNLAVDLSVPSGFPPNPLGQSNIFEYLGSLTLVNKGLVTFPSSPGPYSDIQLPRPENFWMGGGGHFEAGNPRLSFLASGDIDNQTGHIWTGAINIATQKNYLGGGILSTSSNPNYPGTLQAGSIMIKAGHDIIQSTDQGSFLTADGSLFGGMIQLYALHDIIYNATEFAPLRYTSAISANGSLQGGLVNLHAGHDILMNAGATPQPEWYFSQIISANGTSTMNGRGGLVSLYADNSRQMSNLKIEATGGLRNGTVSLSP